MLAQPVDGTPPPVRHRSRDDQWRSAARGTRAGRGTPRRRSRGGVLGRRHRSPEHQRRDSVPLRPGAERKPQRAQHRGDDGQPGQHGQGSAVHSRLGRMRRSARQRGRHPRHGRIDDEGSAGRTHRVNCGASVRQIKPASPTVTLDTGVPALPLREKAHDERTERDTSSRRDAVATVARAPPQQRRPRRGRHGHRLRARHEPGATAHRARHGRRPCRTRFAASPPLVGLRHAALIAPARRADRTVCARPHRSGHDRARHVAIVQA